MLLRRILAVSLVTLMGGCSNMDVVDSPQEVELATLNENTTPSGDMLTINEELVGYLHQLVKRASERGEVVPDEDGMEVRRLRIPESDCKETRITCYDLSGDGWDLDARYGDFGSIDIVHFHTGVVEGSEEIFPCDNSIQYTSGGFPMQAAIRPEFLPPGIDTRFANSTLQGQGETYPPPEDPGDMVKVMRCVQELTVDIAREAVEYFGEN